MTVLKALEALSTNLWNWRLLIIGEGSERPMLERFIAEHADWKPRVSLIGTSHRVPELLRALDVYVLSSIAEGLSNSLLEAMSSGLPVIATATGGNPEVVVDGQSGLLFPVGDFRRLSEQILLLESKHLREELGREARRRVQQEFSIDSMVMKYDHLYRSLGRKTDIPLRAAFGV
jgi:glycosyltransferase involved in cell wall biosynthesis